MSKYKLDLDYVMPLIDISTAEKTLELSSDKPEALMQMGKVFYKTPEPKQEHLLKAIKMYSRAIQLKPDYAAAFNNRGLAYAKLLSVSGESNSQCNFEKAIIDFTEAIRLRPFEASYYCNRGAKYSELKEREKAIDDFSSAIKYSSDEFKKKTLIFLIRGQEYLAIENYEKAISDFTESIRLSPNETKSFALRARCYLFTGNHDKAREDLAEIRRLKKIM